MTNKRFSYICIIIDYLIQSQLISFIIWMHFTGTIKEKKMKFVAPPNHWLKGKILVQLMSSKFEKFIILHNQCAVTVTVITYYANLKSELQTRQTIFFYRTFPSRKTSHRFKHNERLKVCVSTRESLLKNFPTCKVYGAHELFVKLHNILEVNWKIRKKVSQFVVSFS